MLRTWTLGSVLVASLFGQALADDGDEALVRMGGEVAVPLPERGPRAPDQVIVAPLGGPAIARTEGAGFVVWDPQGGAMTRLPLTGNLLLAASPNGGSVLTGDGNRLTRSRIGTWKTIGEMSVEGSIEAAHFSADGHHVIVASAGPDGRRFTLFGGAVGLELKRLDRPDAQPNGPMAAATGRFAFPARGRIAVYALPRFEGLRDVPIDGDPILALAFASETELVGVQNGRIRRWDSETGKALSDTKLPNKCDRLALSGDGSLVVCAATSEKGTPVVASLVDTASGSVRSTFMAPGRGVPAFDPRGLRVAFPGNAAVPIWEVTIDGVSTVLPAGAVAGHVRALAMLGEAVVALEDGYVRAWDPATRAEAWRIATSASSMAPYGDGTLLLGGDAGLVVYDPKAGTTSVIDAKKKVVAVATRAETLATLERTGRVSVWAPSKRAGVLHSVLAMPLLRGARAVRGVTGVLALGWDGGAIFAEGRVAALPPGKKPQAELVAKEARLAAWLGGELVVVEGDRLRIGERVVERAGIVALAASADGRWVALGGRDGRVVVLDANGVQRFERVAHRGAVTGLTFDLAHDRFYSAGEDGTHGVVLGWRLPK